MQAKAWLALGALAALVSLSALPTALQAQGEGSDAPAFRPVFCSHGFNPTNYKTFSLEPLVSKSDRNDLDDATLASIRQAVIAALSSQGYHYVETPNTKDALEKAPHGDLLVSYGFFPAIDSSHPTVGVFVKLRCGTGTFDLTKWSAGAMIDKPYTADTLVPLATAVASQVPARPGSPVPAADHQGS